MNISTKKSDDFSLEDAEKSAMVAYRSALKSKKSLELMDEYVVDFRIEEMTDSLVEIIELLNQLIQNIDLLRKACHNSAAAEK